ncbi:hypothetical protein [Nocardia acidivorans]|uniref:hypothetical protein n=1 Tax=Nocardia acidivorans TaxID=404580 RepID=UPI000829CF78|nr:hypothetical protein [Nocardia acidivorans]
MAASVIPLMPRRGFTVRRVGERWELVNSRHYGRTVVLASWPRDRHGEAFEHCYRLNGQSAAPVRNTKNAVTAAFT